MNINNKSRNIILKKSSTIPNEYVIESCMFMGNSFKCNSSTLIPREDTEVLVANSLKLIDDIDHQIRIIEIGTGSGNIAVSIALKNNLTKIYTSDISDDALNIAKQNITSYNLEKRVFPYRGDMFDPFKNLGLKKKVDMIISNPPYIPTNKLKTLSKDIIDFEPILALDAGPYGMNIIKKLIKSSPSFLKMNGFLVFEFGEKQDRMVKRLLERSGYFTEIKFYHYKNTNRFVSAKNSI